MQPLPRHAFRFMQTKPGHVLAWFLSSGPQSLVILRTSSIFYVLSICWSLYICRCGHCCTCIKCFNSYQTSLCQHQRRDSSCLVIFAWRFCEVASTPKKMFKLLGRPCLEVQWGWQRRLFWKPLIGLVERKNLGVGSNWEETWDRADRWAFRQYHWRSRWSFSRHWRSGGGLCSNKLATDLGEQKDERCNLAAFERASCHLGVQRTKDLGKSIGLLGEATVGGTMAPYLIFVHFGTPPYILGL